MIAANAFVSFTTAFSIELSLLFVSSTDDCGNLGRSGVSLVDREGHCEGSALSVSTLVVGAVWGADAGSSGDWGELEVSWVTTDADRQFD